MNTRLVVAFRDTAQCRREAGAVQWCISGLDRDSAVPLEVLLSGAASVQLPAEVVGAELHVRDELSNPAWELRGNGTAYPLAARAVQIHRDAAAAFATALPRIAAPWTTRVGWWLLLNMLRVPGMAQLLRRRRARMGE
ncbi:MAG TPA: hypothetical protein VGN77_03395 [Steroidobacteraceae bacterium]|jgi:hypothetical protein|nr:hypothetical protein [Steroidobacteraceae bacterium]